jgi:hypothetical protein
MITSTPLLTLILTTFLFESCLSSSIPVQVDLIFPRSNVVYQPVYPFPIVFALHNFSAAWQYKPTVKWTFAQVNQFTNEETFVGDGSFGWDQTYNTMSPPSDKFLAINSSSFPSQSNQSTWVLEYNFFLDTQECSGSLYRRNKIRFQTNIISGSMPDLTAAGSCPLALGAIAVENRNQPDENCTRLSSPQPDPVSCAFQVDQKAVDQISKKMVELSKCPNAIWPNSTGIGDQCDPFPKKPKSEGNVSRGSSLVLVLSIMLLGVIMSSNLI